jgi:hypothetical protein
MTLFRLIAHLPVASLAILAAIAGLAMAGCSPSSNAAANSAGVDLDAASSALAQSSSPSQAGNVLAAGSGESSATTGAASSAAPTGD